MSGAVASQTISGERADVMNGDHQKESPIDPTGKSLDGQENRNTDLNKESSHPSINGIDKCGFDELPDLDYNKVESDINGVLCSGETLKTSTYKNMSPVKKDTTEYSDSSHTGEGNQGQIAINGTANKVNGLCSDTHTACNSPQSVDSEQEEVKPAHERTDNIFEKFQHSIGKNTDNEDDNSKSENKADLQSQQFRLTLQSEQRESLKDLIKAAASKIDSEQNSPCASTNSIESSDPDSDSNNTLAEQCGDVTSTSKLEQKVLLNPDKGNLFENLARVESPSKGCLNGSLASSDVSNDKTEESQKCIKEPLCSKEEEPLQGVTEDSTNGNYDTTVSKPDKTCINEDEKEHEPIKEDSKPSESDEAMLNTNVLPEGNLSDLDDSLLEEGDEEANQDHQSKADEAKSINNSPAVLLNNEQDAASDNVNKNLTEVNDAQVHEVVMVTEDSQSKHSDDDDDVNEVGMVTEDSESKHPDNLVREVVEVTEDSQSKHPDTEVHQVVEVTKDSQSKHPATEVHEVVMETEDVQSKNLNSESGELSVVEVPCNNKSSTEAGANEEEENTNNTSNQSVEEESSCHKSGEEDLSKKDDKIPESDSENNTSTTDVIARNDASARTSNVDTNGECVVTESTEAVHDAHQESTEAVHDAHQCTATDVPVSDDNFTSDSNTETEKCKGSVKVDDVDISDTEADEKASEEVKNDKETEMDIDTDLKEVKPKTEIKTDLQIKEEASKVLFPKMETESSVLSPKLDIECSVEVKPKSEGDLKTETLENNIPNESRKRVADSPVKEEGAGKKSRLESVVGGLMTRLGKDMNCLKEETCVAEDISSGSETESASLDGPIVEITNKKLHSLMKKHLKVSIESHRSSATIVQLQKKLVALQAEVDTWKSTAKSLADQVLELTTSKKHDKRRLRGNAKNTVQPEDAKVKATAQGLVSSTKRPNGVMSPTNSQAVLLSSKVVTTATMVSPTSVQAKKAAALERPALERRSSLTVREMLDEQRGVISTKTTTTNTTTVHQTTATTVSTSGHSTTPSTGQSTSVSTTATTRSSMVVDLTEDDDPNSPPKASNGGAKSTAVTTLPHPAMTMATGGARPIIPAAALPPGIRPGTYLLQQNPGGGTVLQQLLTPSQVQSQQGHTVVIGTQGGPAVLLQAPPGISTAGNNHLRAVAPVLSGQLKGRAANTPVLVRHPPRMVPGGVVTRPPPPPPLQTAPNQQLHNSQPPLSPNKKTTARKRTAPTSGRGRKKSKQSNGDSSPDCDIMITTVTKPAPAKCHPAPLPPQPTSQASGNSMKLLPPKPTLKISRVAQGIVLSWNVLSLTDQFEEIINYQLFAYQEGSALPSALLWKKVGDVKALPLPMACTLTQFQEGNRYHFAVRAMDKHQRVGPFSDPSSIHLSGKS